LAGQSRAVGHFGRSRSFGQRPNGELDDLVHVRSTEQVMTPQSATPKRDDMTNTRTARPPHASGHQSPLRYSHSRITRLAILTGLCFSGILIVGCSSPTPQTVTVSVTPTVASMTSAAAPGQTRVAPPVVATTNAPTSSVPAAPAAQPSQAALVLMPDVTCMNLQAAQDRIQTAGVFFSRSEDASGAGRMQVLDRNWTVVSQSPPAGTPIGEGDAMLSVVKIGEPLSVNMG